ncbi:hypothetical protein [Actinophytocola sp.]|uniref:hypothetical protein n=1 Tax=Actinophytocola sp. TaxID=1872138 RepID=UPI002D7E6554|nr:hypothetical protein [Actinophytocola sp.]HET9144022.1 hypothetical protein [Actinophytocola sp.]
MEPDDKAAALAQGDTPHPATTDADYVAAANAYYASPSAVLPARPRFCPECGEDKPAETDVNAEHGYADNGVLLIGCEGYHVQNPNTFGITAPHWQDWRNRVALKRLDAAQTP